MPVKDLVGGEVDVAPAFGAPEAVDVGLNIDCPDLSMYCVGIQFRLSWLPAGVSSA
jgi:hypothetical protein